MQPATLTPIQQCNTKKKCGIFSKVTMKTPEERQCFLMSSCQWGRSGGHSCTWICFNIYLSIIYFIWYRTTYKMRQTRVPPNITRSTKLRGTQPSLQLAFRSMDFHVPENLIFSALYSCIRFYCLRVRLSWVI